MLDAHDIGVGKRDLDQRRIVSCCHLNNDLKIGNAFQQRNGADLFAQQFTGQRQIFRRHIGENFQFFVRVAAHSPQHGAGLDTLHVAGGGHDDGFDIFDDIAAAADMDVFRQRTENAACLCSRISNCDRLCAAERRHDLLAQNGEVLIINMLIHTVSSQTMRCGKT